MSPKLPKYSKNIFHDSTFADKHKSENSKTVTASGPTKSAPGKSAGLSQHTPPERRNNSIVIELCCGSANFSFHISLYELATIPVDWLRNNHKSKVPFVKLDLSVSAECKVLEDLIDSGNVRCILAAVPCGTASRAREIPLPDGSRGPPPLRSQEHPRGFPWLKGVDKTRVEKANLIYDNCLSLILRAHHKGAICILENPMRSWLWTIPEYHELLEFGFIDVDLQHCKFFA